MKKKISKIISWTLLILTVLSLGLMVRRPSADGPEPVVSPDAARSFDEKWSELAVAHQQGRPSEVRLTESEVNSKIQQAFEVAPDTGLARLKGVSTRLEEDRLVFVLTIHVLGMDTYITLGGKPSLVDHGLEFDLSEAKMGSMPVPASTIAPFLREKFDAPEMREAMKLPDFIRDVRVENGELVFDSD